MGITVLGAFSSDGLLWKSFSVRSVSFANLNTNNHTAFKKTQIKLQRRSVNINLVEGIITATLENS